MHLSTRREVLKSYLFVLPFVFIFVSFIIYPLLMEVYYSFTRYEIGLTPKFIGLQNFIDLLDYPDYRQSIINTLIFIGVGVNIKLLLALFIALFLNRDFKGRSIVQALFLLPWAAATISSLLSFRWMLDTDYGVLNAMLPLLGFEKIQWLGQYSTAMFMIVVYHIWKYLPFWTLIFLSGLKGIPTDVNEAARVDGASSIQTLRWITLPMIKGLYIVCTLISVIWTMGDFIIVYMLTGGGPGQSTNVLATLAYRFAFRFGEFDNASACFVFLFPVMILIIIFVIKKLESSSEQ
ncbi:MAG: sugar ABC transporter permease [Deltaproteobacteria bacterium]|nr:sugar ABC transporter permease [Deltaproteobacteria bacterium]MBW1961136.1 sugar ABC transporter permease [Deltaproteobacteria bacterium]MBW1995210.1 sugar ABC transporter permease [Deltaproteobacteria bacterium]MBW2152938.1 sugar ABC transporter permease [Deltaproteobacteria bacterium]